MDEIFVRIQGLVSEQEARKLYLLLGIEKPSHLSRLLFIDYSYFNVPIAFKFLFLIEISDLKTVRPVSGELMMVTQQWAKPFSEGIPAGHQTVCEVRFDEESYEIITSVIQTSDYWQNLKGQYLLANINTDGWKKYYASNSKS